MRIKKPIEKWFDVPGDPDGARVLIGHLLPGETAEIADETITFNPLGNGNKTTYDRKKDRELTIKKALKDWENFFDADGGPMPCNDDNKIRAMNEIDGFLAFISECRESLSIDAVAQQKDQEKN